MKHRILIVDDDQENISSTKYLLESQGYVANGANSGAAALELLRRAKEPYSVVLVDYFMPGMNGVETSRKILSLNPDQIIAMNSCDDSKELVKEAMRTGVVDYIEKEIDPREFLIRLDSLCAKFDQTTKPIVQEFSGTQDEAILRKNGLTGRSKALANVARNIEQFANESETLLITGETGTGKEVVANSIHRVSYRSSQPFVAINCAAIPPNLIESTLFGHEKGAFTGAIKSQAGKFRLANRGTIFLDEIGDLPLDLQAKLLRVLQEKTFEPVGSNRSETVDIRIITATHRDLEQMVKEGKFREDLFYRLNVITISIPPLRDRIDDIEPLVAHFTDEYNQSKEFKKRFERRTLSVLMNYTWPGNVRELKNMVEAHLIRCTGSTVKVEHLDSKYFNRDIVGTDLKTLETKQKDELKKFIEVQIRASSSRAEAARRLGIVPSLLHYYVKNYGITTE